MSPALKKEEVSDKRDALRLWLQLLTLTTLVEKKIRRNLQEEFGTTLPRFDVMAALERADGRLTMGELSRKLLVSKGNVTWIVTSLVKQGLVKRERDQQDKRTHYLSLTEKGRAEFAQQAEAHRRWITEMIADADPGEVSDLAEKMGHLKEIVKARQNGGGQ